MFNFDDDFVNESSKPIKRRDFNGNPPKVKIPREKKRFKRNCKYPNYLEDLLEEEGYDPYSDNEDF